MDCSRKEISTMSLGKAKFCTTQRGDLSLIAKDCFTSFVFFS